MAATRSGSRSDDARVKPRSDAYVGLLALSLLALSAATLFGFLNWQGISQQPPAVKMAPTGGGARTPAPMAPGGGQVPPGGGQMPPGGGQMPPGGGQMPPGGGAGNPVPPPVQPKQ